MPNTINGQKVYSVILGSRAYGTNVEGSDTDERGVFLEPRETLLGLSKTETQTKSGDEDSSYIGMRHFFGLALRGNVYALEMLYLDREHIRQVEAPMLRVLAAREAFVSRYVIDTYGGYAIQCLKQLRTKPGADGKPEADANHGYNTKMAMHAVRLWRSGTELLEGRELQVSRPDAAELLEIRYGKYSFEEFAVMETEGKRQRLVGGFAAKELQKFEEAAAATRLPVQPNFERIQNLLISINEENLGLGRSTSKLQGNSR